MSELSFPRAESFLAGTCALERAAPLPGQRELFEEFVRGGRRDAPLAPLLARAAELLGSPALPELLPRAAELLGEVRQAGPIWQRHPGPALAAERLGDLLWEGRACDLRLVGLLLCYGAERWAIPHPCLGGDDEIALRTSREAARLLLGAKLREAVYSLEGELLLRESGDAGAGHYRGPSGASLLVEWHELQAAEERWRATG